MRFSTLQTLTNISQQHSTEFGKIVQLLLAISLSPKRGGFQVLCRLSEGVDLELIGQSVRYAVEVKSTTGTSDVVVAEKDVIGLRQKAENDGYSPALAALKIQRSADWVIANASRLKPGSWGIERLRLDSIAPLEQVANTHLDNTVDEFAVALLSPIAEGPLEFLKSVLIRENQTVQ